MPSRSPLVSATSIPPPARSFLRKARSAVRLLKDDPADFGARVRRRARRHTRRASPTARRHKREAPPLTLAAWLPVPMERGYVIMSRLRGFEIKSYAVTIAVQDGEGNGLKPGREWKYSHSLGGYYMYPEATEKATVTLPVAVPGESASRIEIAVRRWSNGARPPAEVFGSTWLVYAQVREAGADPHRLAVVPLRPAD